MPSHDADKVVDRVAACARAIREQLGPGLDCSEYETALDRRMRGNKLQFARQYPVSVPFDGPADRGFYADFIVEGVVLLELKRVDDLTAEDTDQAFNYLRESGADICLLINFGRPNVEIRRIEPSGDWSTVAS